MTGDRWIYGMKIVAILPFPGQERAGFRPLAALHGVAVGPMQGGLGRDGVSASASASADAGAGAVEEGDERWRLLLMFQDHSVLAYEIGRKGDGHWGSGGVGVGVGGIMI